MEPYPPKPLGKGSMLALRFWTGLLVALVRSVLFLIDLVRWLFAPLVLLLQLLFMVPYARRLRLRVARHNFQQIDESQLPIDAYIHFAETAARFALIGFRRGPYVRLDGPTDGQITYAMPLVHADLRIGMGINFGVVSDVSGSTVSTNPFTELTAECGAGRMLDFTNSGELEPFVPANRTRVRLPELDEVRLLHLFSGFAQRSGCTLSDATLTDLLSSPDEVMWNEFRDGMQQVAAQGFLTGTDENQAVCTTWKGAVQAGMLVQWPLSVFVDRRRGRANDSLFADVDMTRDDADRMDIGDFLDPLALTDADLASVTALLRLTDPLAQRFSPAMQLAGIGYYYDGNAATHRPTNIVCTYVLRTSDRSRELLRRTELQLDIDISSGRFNWVAVDDAHYATEDYDTALDADTAQPLSVASEVLLPLRDVITLTERLRARHAVGQTPRSDTLLVVEENGRTQWYRQTLLSDGGMLEIDLDGISGEVLRDEQLS